MSQKHIWTTNTSEPPYGALDSHPGHGREGVEPCMRSPFPCRDSLADGCLHPHGFFSLMRMLGETSYGCEDHPARKRYARRRIQHSVRRRECVGRAHLSAGGIPRSTRVRRSETATFTTSYTAALTDVLLRQVRFILRRLSPNIFEPSRSCCCATHLGAGEDLWDEHDVDATGCNPSTSSRMVEQTPELSDRYRDICIFPYELKISRTLPSLINLQAKLPAPAGCHIYDACTTAAWRSKRGNLSHRSPMGINFGVLQLRLRGNFESEFTVSTRCGTLSSCPAKWALGLLVPVPPLPAAANSMTENVPSTSPIRVLSSDSNPHCARAGATVS
ncbi:hypothetical protein C8R45DRAFT_1080752 [Mycena sanguinolenta]|nr:hypothetical protein C8R45DRAFT_1080752 [Mycena sanguinolenta]